MSSNKSKLFIKLKVCYPKLSGKHPSKRTFQPSLEPILFQARALDMPAPARIPEQKVFLGARSTAVFPSSTAVFPSADSGISSLNTSTSGSRRSVRHTLIH